MKPIIFIPGIQATSLVNTNTFDFNYIWNAYDNLGSSISTSLLGAYIIENLQLDPLYDEGIEKIIERGHIARLPYEGTIIKLKQKLRECDGDLKDTPIYLFGYDWRMSNMESGRKLKAFVEYLKNKLKDKNIDGFRFLTHSMGGLVFSCYLSQLNNDYSDVDKAVITAPPFLGSPYALVHMIKGDGGLKSILNWAVGRNEDVRKVIRTYPGVYELLPVYKNALTYIDDNSELNLLFKNYWQQNIYNDIEKLFDARLELLERFRTGGMKNLSELPQEVRDKIIIVAGEGDKTYTHVKIQRQKKDISNFVDLDSLKKGAASGDGTVPFVSATVYKDSITTLAVKKENFFDELSNNVDFHGLFLRDSRVENIIQRYFTDSENKLKSAAITQWWETPNDSVRKL